MPATFLQVPISDSLDRTEPRAVELDQSSQAVLLLASFLRRCSLGLVHVPEAGKVQKLAVHLLLGVLVRHPTETALGTPAGTETPVPVHADLPRAVATCGIVAGQPAFVVPGSLFSDLAFELCDDGQDREWFLAALVGTDDPVRRAHVGRLHKSLEHGLLLAEATAQGQPGRVGETDRVRDLRLQWEDLTVLLVARVGCVDLVLANIETQALGQADSVGAGDWSTETLNGREDLFEQVELDIWFETGVLLQYVLWAVGSLGRRQRRGFRVTGRHDIRNHIVRPDILAPGDVTKRNLRRWHALLVGVFFGPLGEFLSNQSISKRFFGTDGPAYRVDDIFLHRNRVFLHFARKLAQVVVDVVEDNFLILTGQDLVKKP